MNLHKKIYEHNIFKKGLLIILLVALVFAAGYFIGAGQKTAPEPERVAVEMPCNLENNKPEDVAESDFGIFWETWKILKTNYLKRESLTAKQMIYGAAEGLVDATKDPYSMFLSPSDAQKFEEDISGSFGGIGIEIGIKKEILTVIAPLKDTPAEKAGLKAGDQILKIDDALTYNLSIDESVKLIRGKLDTEVNLTIYREGWEKTQEFKIKRDIIKVPSLKLETIDAEGKEIAHLQLYNFNENSNFDFYKTAVELLIKKPDGLMLDLRNNPGGYLEIAVNIAGWFLKDGEIVVKQISNGEEPKIMRADGEPFLADIPMVILINEGSASAAEILAGALRDNKQIKLIGEKTFGKGSVQNVKTLSDGSMVKFTIANWLTPKDHLIEGQGLEPDIKVKITEEDIKQKNDPQFAKAKEALIEEINKQKANHFDWKLELPNLKFL